MLSVVTAMPNTGPTEGEFAGAVRPIVAGEVQRWVVAIPGDQEVGPQGQDGRWLPVQVSELNADLLSAVGIGDAARTVARAWRRMPSSAAAATPVLPATQQPSKPSEAENSLQPADRPSAVAAIETQLAEVGANEHLTAVSLSFSRKVDPSGWSISFDSPTSLIDVLGDSSPVEFAVDGTTLRLPDSTPAVNLLVLRFRTGAAGGWLSTRDQIPFPQGPFEVTHWLWRISVPESRYIMGAPDLALGAAGTRSLSWMQRWFGPLGRRDGEATFNPTNEGDWSQVLRGHNGVHSTATEHRQPRHFGRRREHLRLHLSGFDPAGILVGRSNRLVVLGGAARFPVDRSGRSTCASVGLSHGINRSGNCRDRGDLLTAALGGNLRRHPARWRRSIPGSPFPRASDNCRRRSSVLRLDRRSSSAKQFQLPLSSSQVA